MILDCSILIDVPAGNWLSFASGSDSLILSPDTTMNGTGIVFIHGFLNASGSEIAQSPLVFYVCPSGTVFLPSVFVLAESDFYNFGTMENVQSIFNCKDTCNQPIVFFTLN